MMINMIELLIVQRVTVTKNVHDGAIEADEKLGVMGLYRSLFPRNWLEPMVREPWNSLQAGKLKEK